MVEVWAVFEWLSDVELVLVRIFSSKARLVEVRVDLLICSTFRSLIVIEFHEALARSPILTKMESSVLSLFLVVSDNAALLERAKLEIFFGLRI